MPDTPANVVLPTEILSIPLQGFGADLTNCYVLCSPDGTVTLIDPGVDSLDNWGALVHMLSAHGLEPSGVRLVVLTHLHRDHLGLAPLIRQRTGATVALLRQEQAAIDRLSSRSDLGLTLSVWGVPVAHRDALARNAGSSGGVPAFTADRLLDNGDDLGIVGYSITAVSTPGHTPGHLCLVDRERRVLISGDLVLPDVYPGLGLAGGEAAWVVADYLASLDAMAEFDGYLVAPGHGPVFSGLATRVEQTRAHQLRRADAVAKALAAHPTASVWEIASRLSWRGGWQSLSGYRLFAALRQTDVHIDYVRRSDSRHSPRR